MECDGQIQQQWGMSSAEDKAAQGVGGSEANAGQEEKNLVIKMVHVSQFRSHVKPRRKTASFSHPGKSAGREEGGFMPSRLVTEIPISSHRRGSQAAELNQLRVPLAIIMGSTMKPGSSLKPGLTMQAGSTLRSTMQPGCPLRSSMQPTRAPGSPARPHRRHREFVSHSPHSPLRQPPLIHSSKPRVTTKQLLGFAPGRRRRLLQHFGSTLGRARFSHQLICQQY